MLSLAAHPGLAATSLLRGRRGRLVEAAESALIGLLGHDDVGGAQPTLMAATADLPGDTYVGPTGRFGARGEPGPVERSARAEDTQMARSLWSLSEELTGVSFPLGGPVRMPTTASVVVAVTKFIAKSSPASNWPKTWRII